MRFDNTVALVTGAGRGIGQATAGLLAAQGCRVVCVSRTERQLQQTVEWIESTGGQAKLHVADVADEQAVRQLFTEVRRDWGPVQILVNNAGVFTASAVETHSVEAWDRVMNINVRSMFLCSREVFRDCQASGQGAAIINIGSLAGVRGTDKFGGLSSYVTSKFAVVGLTESFAVEGRGLGIRVNCIAPGAVDTQMLKEAAPHLRTSTTPDHIARTVVHLADPNESGHLSGALIEVFSNL